MARHAQSGSTKAGEGNIVDGILRVLKRLSPHGRTYFQMRLMDENPFSQHSWTGTRGKLKVRGRRRPRKNSLSKIG